MARPGLFREADGGTLFLDEIGDISPALQSRLLRALQEHEIVPVGAEAPVSVDVRIIAATHRDLPQLVRDGRFREDLYYRLHVVSLTLPPLRSRRQDLPLLIDDLLRRLAERHDRGPVAVDPEAQALLLAYDWPGNVRELHNVLERALVLASQDVIGPEHLPVEIRQQDASRRAASDAAGATEDDAGGARLPLADVERHHVLRVLRAMDGSRERTARVLGISRRTLTRMLQRWRPDTVRPTERAILSSRVSLSLTLCLPSPFFRTKSSLRRSAVEWSHHLLRAGVASICDVRHVPVRARGITDALAGGSAASDGGSSTAHHSGGSFQ